MVLKCLSFLTSLHTEVFFPLHLVMWYPLLPSRTFFYFSGHLTASPSLLTLPLLPSLASLPFVCSLYLYAVLFSPLCIFLHNLKQCYCFNYHLQVGHSEVILSFQPSLDLQYYRLKPPEHRGQPESHPCYSEQLCEYDNGPSPPFPHSKVGRRVESTS